MLNTSPHAFSEVNRYKADFQSIYAQPDPRAYHKKLGDLDYVIPHLAQPVLAQLVEALVHIKRRRITVLDLGCSYGINSALLKYGISLDTLRSRYNLPSVQRLSPAQLLDLDRHFTAAWPARDDVRVIGLDVSHHAVRYAEQSRFIDLGIVADLESQELPAGVAEQIAEVDLIVSTGCVGYVTRRTFEKLALCNKGRAPWVASFVLRVFDYGEITDTLAAQELVTERFDGATFIQRRFRDEDEMAATLRELDRAGIDAAGKEAAGLFHADLFVSRPQSDVDACPIHRLISISSGANRIYAPRPEL
jgi:hypothetical protein